MAEYAQDETFVSLEAFAEVTAALECGRRREDVLREKGLTPEAWEAAQTSWLAKLASHASEGRLRLPARFVELLAAARAEVSARIARERKKPVGPLPRAPVVKLKQLTTVKPKSAPAGWALARATPLSVRRARLTSTQHPQDDASAGPRPGRHGARNEALFRTAFVLPELAARPALPFQKGGGEMPAANPSAPGDFSRTVALEGANPSLKDTLPLPDPEAPKRDTTPPMSAVPMTVRSSSHAALEPALPFQRGSQPPGPRPPVPEPTPFNNLGASPPPKTPANPASGAAAATGAAPVPPPAPSGSSTIERISLMQYAQICAAVRRYPERVLDIRNHYRLDADAWRSLHALWQERFQKDPMLRARWQAHMNKNMPP